MFLLKLLGVLILIGFLLIGSALLLFFFGWAPILLTILIIGAIRILEPHFSS